jgi:hypothetical protein
MAHRTSRIRPWLLAALTVCLALVLAAGPSMA